MIVVAASIRIFTILVRKTRLELKNCRRRQISKLFAFYNLHIKHIREALGNCFEVIANIILKSFTQSTV